jgi:hypothetical protein
MLGSGETLVLQVGTAPRGKMDVKGVPRALEVGLEIVSVVRLDTPYTWTGWMTLGAVQNQHHRVLQTGTVLMGVMPLIAPHVQRGFIVKQTCLNVRNASQERTGNQERVGWWAVVRIVLQAHGV